MLIGAVTVLSALSAVLFGLRSGEAWLWVAPVSFLATFLALAALIFLLVWLLCAVVDVKKPQEKDNRFYRFVVNLLCQAAYPILGARLHVEGAEKMPKQGRFLLVCNHISDMDPVTILKAFPRKKLAFISKRENDQRFIVGPLLHKILCQPINRENNREALKTILKCIDILKQDMASVAVFPEGYTSMDGLLRHFRYGVFKIAQKARVPIVVCTLKNTDKIFGNALKKRNTRVQLRLVEVIRPEEFAGMTTVALGERIYELMAEDLGPELVYNPGEKA